MHNRVWRELCSFADLVASLEVVHTCEFIGYCMAAVYIPIFEPKKPCTAAVHCIMDNRGKGGLHGNVSIAAESLTLGTILILMEHNTKLAFYKLS